MAKIRNPIIMVAGTGGGGGELNDLDFIKYHDKMIQIETGRIPPTDQEYENVIIPKGYQILDKVFRGIV